MYGSRWGLVDRRIVWGLVTGWRVARRATLTLDSCRVDTIAAGRVVGDGCRMDRSGHGGLGTALVSVGLGNLHRSYRAGRLHHTGVVYGVCCFYLAVAVVQARLS